MRAILFAALLLFAAPAWADGPCPATSPARWLQSDAGSGRDAGDVPGGSVGLPGEGWHYGAFTVPVEDRMDDVHDWFRYGVAGPTMVRLDVDNAPNAAAGADALPLIFFLEAWTQGAERPLAEAASWEPPLDVDVSEPLWLHVFPSPLMWFEACDAADPTSPLPAVPAAAPMYGVYAARLN